MVKIRLRRMGARNRPVLPHRRLRLAPDGARRGARGARLLRPGRRILRPLSFDRERARSLDRQGRDPSRRRCSRCSSGPSPRRFRRPEPHEAPVETVVRRLSDRPDEDAGHARASRARRSSTTSTSRKRPRPPDRPRGPHDPRPARLRVRRRHGARQARPHPRPRLTRAARRRARCRTFPNFSSSAASSGPTGSRGRSRLEVMHGLSGALRAGRRLVWQRGSERAVADAVGASRPHGERLLLAFEGVDGRRGRARALRAAISAWRRRTPCPPRRGSSTSHEIRGWVCEDAAGRRLGDARRDSRARRPVLCSRSRSGPGRSRSFRSCRAIVVASRPPGRRIVLDPPEGLLDSRELTCPPPRPRPPRVRHGGQRRPMQIEILTIFPGYFESPLRGEPSRQGDRGGPASR